MVLIMSTAVKGKNVLLPDLGGEYTDPNHYTVGSDSFAGTRMISDHFGDNLTERITVVGTDDGLEYWTLFGEWTDMNTGKLVVDFSPKGGPKGLSGIFSSSPKGGGQIDWEDGNVWEKASSPENVCHVTFHPVKIILVIIVFILLGYLAALCQP